MASPPPVAGGRPPSWEVAASSRGGGDAGEPPPAGQQVQREQVADERDEPVPRAAHHQRPGEQGPPDEEHRPRHRPAAVLRPAEPDPERRGGGEREVDPTGPASRRPGPAGSAPCRRRSRRTGRSAGSSPSAPARSAGPARFSRSCRVSRPSSERSCPAGSSGSAPGQLAPTRTACSRAHSQRNVRAATDSGDQGPPDHCRDVDRMRPGALPGVPDRLPAPRRAGSRR